MDGGWIGVVAGGMDGDNGLDAVQVYDPIQDEW